MPGKCIYEYSVIRLVPRVEREEFINIGVLLFCKRENYLKAKIELDNARILSLFPNVDLEFIKNYIEEIKNIVDGTSDNTYAKSLDIPSKFRWISAKKSTMIQFSPIHSGTCNDLDLVLDELYSLMVLE